MHRTDARRVTPTTLFKIPVKDLVSFAHSRVNGREITDSPDKLSVSTKVPSPYVLNF
jgi:hypothetical protein